ncbi:MAG TPA: S41 family peptidase, partial [Chitinophagaceae bacterium]|nr:S41 family peptidase [Chitinophagaceae bacterium]
LRSFSASYSTMLDSAYNAVMPEIRKRRNLIIDVRNNGGGSDRNYKALMPLIATGDVTHDVVDLFATPDNIRAYEAMRDLYKSKPEIYGKEGYMSWQPHLEKMQKQQPYTFVPMMSDKPAITRYRPARGNPRKIAIIYNRNCASSCESLLFEASYSNKVITVGENSGGYTGYGNVMNTTTPCGRTLSWTTTRYRRQRQYDFTGIPPQYRVPAEEANWIDYTRKLLSNL